ncbi:MAG: hypothetical protein J7639_21830 [Paenibacillaceae bacterium]|uniref:LiaF transmembrane domain-containing protein n=1 Tax=Paenibacillus cymbidii TaxID=1639034 RepID=UPI001081A5A7|nr:hypothetical protein [Paenibacillus cymbidii]MBO9608608.1 hypothetical protein [Paenibacillaceae bacterium]
MKLNKGTGFALLLIAFGALMLLSKIGIHFGGLFAYIIPIALIGFGYIGVKNGKSLIGWVLIVLGAVLLLGKLSSLIGIAIAIGLIVFGFSMLRNKSA